MLGPGIAPRQTRRAERRVQVTTRRADGSDRRRQLEGTIDVTHIRGFAIFAALIAMLFFYLQYLLT